jgi:hypothetical protein
MSEELKPELLPCQQPTKRKWVNGDWVDEPGRCGNRGPYLFHGKYVCKKHLNMLSRPVDLERLAREVADDYRQRGSVRADRLDRLAAFLAGSQKGKQ